MKPLFPPSKGAMSDDVLFVAFQVNDRGQGAGTSPMSFESLFRIPSPGSRESLNRLLKNAICVVALHPSSLRRTPCTTHSSRFVRLACHRFSPACSNQTFSTGCYTLFAPGPGLQGGLAFRITESRLRVWAPQPSLAFLYHTWDATRDENEGLKR